MILTEEKLEKLLSDLGIDVISYTASNLICYCPFHSNRDTPAFSIAKHISNHPFMCFNPACAKKGTVTTLVSEINSIDIRIAKRYILSYNPTQFSLPKKVDKRDYKILDSNLLHSPMIDYSPSALGYMIERGFSIDTLQDFKVGFYSEFGSSYIIIPAFDENNNLVGFTRRLIGPTRKYYDQGLPKKQILFNLNNARRYQTIIICEGPMDVIAVHDAGFANVVGVLSGNFSDIQQSLLQKHARNIIIFTDNDTAGKKLGKNIAASFSGGVYWAKYPGNYKDPGEMPKENIVQAIEGKQSDIHHKIKGGNT